MAFVLIGFMGAGKSTVADELATVLGVSALDSDALLEQRLGHPVAREFELSGEASFRAEEEEIVCDLLGRTGAGEVIALGGGSVLSERVRMALQGHVTVLLDVDANVAWERVRAVGDGAERPLARDREAFVALHAERQALYEQAADAVLADLPLGGAQRALAALRALAGAPAGTRMLWARSSSGEYPVFVGRGLLNGSAESGLGEIWPFDRSRSRPFCVSDETVSALYGARLDELAGTFTIPPGEEHKTLVSAERVWHALAHHARRPGRLSLWRQDRRGPARGQELCRRLPPAGRCAGGS
jgi:shikimate kinase/3-dehydroquinate synthase